MRSAVSVSLLLTLHVHTLPAPTRCLIALLGSRPQQRLDRAALVHRAVSLGDLLERQAEIEDLAWVDLAVPDQLGQLGQEAAHRRGTCPSGGGGTAEAAGIEPTRPG